MITAESEEGRDYVGEAFQSQRYFMSEQSKTAPELLLLKGKQIRRAKPSFENMSWIPGGNFMMGSNDHYPEEAPAHPVTVNSFWMDQYAVTNAQFSRFVEETNYVTSAERAPRAEDYLFCHDTRHAIKWAHNLAHKNVLNKQLKQWMQ